MISGQAELSVGFEVSVAPGDVVPDVPLAVPCIVGQEVSIPGETKQKGEGAGSHNKG